MDDATTAKIVELLEQAQQQDAAMLAIVRELVDDRRRHDDQLAQLRDELRALSNRIEAVAQLRGGLHSVKV